MKIFRQFLKQCKELGDLSDVEKIGLIASVRFQDQADVDKIDEYILCGDWAAVCGWMDGNFTEDIIHLQFRAGFSFRE